MPVWLGPSWMLRERCGPVRVMPLQSKHSLAAHGPGCIPWNSDLRQRLFQNLPVPKIGKKPKQCCSFRPVNVKMLLESVGEETAGRFWSLHVKVRNSFAHALLQHTAGSVGSGADCPNLRGFCSSRPPIPPSTAPCKWCEWPLHAKIRNSFAHALFQHTAGSVGSGANSPNLRGFCSSQPSIPSLTLPQNPSQKEVTAGASAGDEIQPTSNKIAVLTHTMPIFAFVPAAPCNHMKIMLCRIAGGTHMLISQGNLPSGPCKLWFVVLDVLDLRRVCWVLSQTQNMSKCWCLCCHSSIPTDCSSCIPHQLVVCCSSHFGRLS